MSSPRDSPLPQIAAAQVWDTGGMACWAWAQGSAPTQGGPFPLASPRLSHRWQPSHGFWKHCSGYGLPHAHSFIHSFVHSFIPSLNKYFHPLCVRIGAVLGTGDNSG